MDTKRKESRKSITGGANRRIGGGLESGQQGKYAISPAERWMMITDRAYSHAQQRGFMDGSPLEDWLEAEKEIDTR
jgi:hypothetical protein